MLLVNDKKDRKYYINACIGLAIVLFFGICRHMSRLQK